MKRILAILGILAILFSARLVQLSAYAANPTYTFSGTGNWTDPAKWDTYPGTTIPASARVEIMGDCKIPLLTVITIQTDARLTNNASSKLTNFGTINNIGGRLTNVPLGMIDNFGTLTNSAAGKLSNDGGTLENKNGGVISSDGILDNFGVLNNSGAVTSNGTLSLSGGTLDNSASNIVVGNGATIDRSGGVLSVAPSFLGTVNLVYSEPPIAAITTGPELPTSTSALTDLTIDNSAGVTLSAGATVNGTLTLTNGNLTTGPSNLLTIASTGVIVRTSGHIVGGLQKTAVPLAFTFEVGTDNGYTPLSVANATGGGSLSVRTAATPQPSLDPTKSLQEFWAVNLVSGLLTADITLNYLESDVPATSNEGIFEIIRVSGITITPFPNSCPSPCVNTANNTAIIGGVTTFSDWTVGEPGQPTAVNLISFAARSFDSGTFIEWQTGFEVDNLGFNIYREERGKRAMVNSQLLAGSALKDGAALAAGESYVWCDPTRATRDTLYWLEDLDVKGASTWHGPFVATQASGQPPSRRVAAEMSNLGNQPFDEGSTRVVERMAPVSARSVMPASAASLLGSQGALKITVRSEGWYRVTQPELVAAGFNTRVDPRFLQLFAGGREAPMYVSTAQSGLFDGSSAIEFYGIGSDTPSSDARVYWLATTGKEGKRIGQFKTAGAPSFAPSFTQTVERKDRTIYFSALRNGDTENFFGAVVAGAGVDQTVDLNHLAESDNGRFATTLEVALQGVTVTPHRVLIQLNGYGVSEITFSGQNQGVSKITINHSLLREGENVVRLIPQNGAGDISLVDHIRISYQHTFNADDDELRFDATGGVQVSIEGFSSRSIRIFDVTDSSSVQELVGDVNQTTNGFAVAVAARESGVRNLIALTDARVRKAESVQVDKPSSWHRPSNAGDFIIIGASELLTSIEPLKAARQAEGYKVVLIDVEDLYDEFNFGHKSPQAIKDFLTFAASSWKVAPKFVLFAGDSSFDARNYLGLGYKDLVPTKLVDTSFLETASDDWFADFDDDGVPELAVGRLPVRTVEEAAAVVSKILRYSQSKSFASVTLTSDVNDGFNFEQASTELRPLVPATSRIEEIKRGDLDDDTAREKLLDAIDRGQTLINYVGHGSANQWRSALLTSADAGKLTNWDRLPVFVMMTCLTGYFHDPGADSLAESLIRAEHGGAVAVWASSGMSFPNQQAMINQQLYRLLFGQSKGFGKASSRLTLGEATQRAKSAVVDPDIRRTWILFGDPTMRLR